MKLTDQQAAAFCHWANQGTSFIAGMAFCAIVLGVVSQEQLEAFFAWMQKLGDGYAKYSPLLLMIVGYWAQRQAAKSASPEEQIKKADAIKGVEIKVDPVVAPPAVVAVAVEPTNNIKIDPPPGT